MRSKWLVMALAVTAGVALAQTATSPDLHLRGNRFKPLTYDALTPAQKTMADHLLAGERGGLNGPYHVLLRSPEMGDLAQQYGAYTRYHSTLPKELNELAILLMARSWDAQYVWYAHRTIAGQAGLSKSITEAIAAGKHPAALSSDEAIVYNFCTELLTRHHVSDTTFQAAVARFGERGVVDLMGVLGYYNLVSMVLNVDGYPLPDGARPELQPK
jgi:4-carboxymuconolactone decarboxylase